jgi:hypothetical protein
MQRWQRQGIGLRWIVELPREGPGVMVSLCVENRGQQAVRLRALHPLAIAASEATRIALRAPPSSPRLPLTPDPHGGEPLESLLLLDLGRDRTALLGFVTARRGWTRWTLETIGARVTRLEAVNALGDRILSPGEIFESDRAWLAVGPDRAALMIDWAQRTGLEMDARVPRRGAAIWSQRGRDDRLEGIETSRVHAVEAKEVSDVMDYRARLARERAQLEPGGLLLARAAPFGASVGLADARGDPHGLPPGPQDLELAFTNQRLWLLTPGTLRLATGSLAEARTRASIAGLAGGLLTLNDDVAVLAEERRAILERILPPLARECDAPRVGGVLVTRLLGGRLAVLLLNTEEKHAELGLAFRALDLRGPFHGFDFWENEPLGLLQQGIPPRRVAPGGCRVIGLTPVSDRLQIVGSSLHIGMGTLEVASLRPLPRGGHILSLRLPGTHRGDVWITGPESATTRRIGVAFSDVGQVEIDPARP